jgi:hypothetical protein
MGRSSTAPTTKITCTILRKTVVFAPANPSPASHPIRMPQLAYETLYGTRRFNNKAERPTDSSQPFVWSTGGGEDYFTHADYVFGWEGDSLQKAMETACMFDACVNGKPLKSQTAAQMNACSAKGFVGEQTGGCEFRSILSQYPELTNHQGLTALPGKQTMHRREQSFQG